MKFTEIPPADYSLYPRHHPYNILDDRNKNPFNKPIPFTIFNDRASHWKIQHYTEKSKDCSMSAFSLDIHDPTYVTCQQTHSLKDHVIEGGGPRQRESEHGSSQTPQAYDAGNPTKTKHGKPFVPFNGHSLTPFRLSHRFHRHH